MCIIVHTVICQKISFKLKRCVTVKTMTPVALVMIKLHLLEDIGQAAVSQQKKELKFHCNLIDVFLAALKTILGLHYYT